MNIYATELYKALEKSHPDLWQIKDLHDSKHRYTLIIEPNGDVRKE